MADKKESESLSLGRLASEQDLEKLLSSMSSSLPEAKRSSRELHQEIDLVKVHAVAESAIRKPRIVIIGPANSGKSTFINLLFGSKISEVKNSAGSTTTVATEEHDALGVTLVDTPGFNLNDVDDAKALTAVKGADLLILVFNAPNLDSRKLWDKFRKMPLPMIPVFNKADLLTAKGQLEIESGTLDSWGVPEPRLFTSFLTGWNLAAVIGAICCALPLECRAAFIGWLSDELEAKKALLQQIREEARRQYENAKDEAERRRIKQWEERESSQADARAREIASTTRDDEADRTIWAYSAISAGIAVATPVPILDCPLTIGCQVRMITALAAIYGHSSSIASITGAFGGLLARAVVRTLLAGLTKLIPFLGEVLDATVTFAATFALGKTAKAFFRGDIGSDAFSSYFSSMKQQGEIEAQEALAKRSR